MILRERVVITNFTEATGVTPTAVRPIICPDTLNAIH